MAISIGVFFAVFMYAFLGGVVAGLSVRFGFVKTEIGMLFSAVLWPLAAALFLGITLTAVVIAAFDGKISHKEGNND